MGMGAGPADEARVRVPVATLWRDPALLRPVDCAAVAPGADITEWVAGLRPDEFLCDAVLTQLLLGERVRVTEVRPDGWVRVVALEQPAGRLDPGGYPGWLPARQLALGGEDPAGDPLVVGALRTDLHDAPDGLPVLAGVVLGTRLTAAGPARRGWLPVHVPGRAQPLWAAPGQLAPVDPAPPPAARVLDVARRLRDTVYLWGGVSPAGIDCSGLVQVVWRRFGVRLPRDADDQAAATRAVRLGTERPGDLYLFARPGRPIHHIGIVSAEPGPGDDRRMLHACYVRRRVLEEPLPADRTATLVGVHRV